MRVGCGLASAHVEQFSADDRPVAFLKFCQQILYHFVAGGFAFLVGTFGVLYNYEAETEEDELDEEGSQIWANVADDFGSFSGGHGKLAAFSFMLFNLLCAPCFAAMGAIRREMNSAKWTWFAIGYMCVFAYAIALLVWQLGLLFAGAVNVPGLIVAVALLAVFGYMLFRPYKESVKLA
jgi:ferrous iron transport protein B